MSAQRIKGFQSGSYALGGGVPGASHCDLYDGGDKNAIPFDKIETFYRENLK